MNNSNKFTRKIAIFIGSKIYEYSPSLFIFLKKLKAKRYANTIKRYKTISASDFCNKYDGRITIVEEEKDRVVYKPPYMLKEAGRECVLKSPAIYIAELSNVFVHGGTGLVLSDEYAITDVCINDREDRVEYSFGPLIWGTKKEFYVEVSSDADEVDCAVNLCGLASGNYYHLTVEILSRFKYVEQYLQGKKVSILLDEDAKKYPQFVDLVDCVLKGENVIYVSKFKRVRCKSLILPSMNTWMPINIKKKSGFRIEDNLIAQSAVDNIRDATKSLRLPGAGKKVFLSRKNTSLSRLINEKQISELFQERGFEIVCTEDLSYKEQVALFSSSTIIVGATGAALTNLLYCNSGTVFGCIVPRDYEFYIYSSLAFFAGCKELFLDADIKKSGSSISGMQYEADIKECACFIDELEKLSLGRLIN